MNIISWNVNGLRAITKKNFHHFIQEESPDILCLQETKLQSHQLPEVFLRLQQKNLNLASDYHHYWHSASKKGYSGVAILTKKKFLQPQNMSQKIGVHEIDEEGRFLCAEYDSFYLICAYFPNAQENLKRLHYKIQFNQCFLDYVRSLMAPATKPVICCGDFNVAHTEIDLKNPKQNHMNPGFSTQERNWFSTFVVAPTNEGQP